MDRHRLRLLAAAWAAVSVLATGQASVPDTYPPDTYHWIGAGTGGNTATDPNDPTTLWGDPNNWWEGRVPTSSRRITRDSRS
jgi:hypothetical protein